jgi:hypothetical protein
MGIWPCRASFTDTEGTSYAVEVQAESYYEAVALAVSECRNDSVTSMPGRMTEFLISIQRRPTEYHIRLGQASKSALWGARRKARPESPGGRR